MELLVHLNKRIKSRPKIQLPVETLLVQYQDPAAASFVTVRINFFAIFKGFIVRIHVVLISTKHKLLKSDQSTPSQHVPYY